MTHLAAVSLAPFGVLGDTTLELAPGLTVVFGPNEAGKSTLLAGLDAVVTGLPRASVHGVRPSDLGVRFTLSGPDAVTEFRRTPSQVLRAEDLSAIDDPWRASIEGWGPWLATHGLDHAALREGGRLLFSGEGDLADIVFLSHEGFSARRLKDRLSRRAEALFRARKGAKSSINDAVLELEAARLSESAATVDPARISVLVAQRDDAQRREAHAHQRRAEAIRDREAVDRDIRALQYVPGVVACQESAARLASAGLMPRDAAVRTRELLDARAALEAERAQLPGVLADLERAIASSPAADPILQDAVAIDAADRGLARAREQHAAGVTERQKERSARDDLVDVLERLRVQPTDDLRECASALLIAEDVAAGLQARADEAQQARSAWVLAREAVREAEGELDARRAELGESASVDPARLAAARGDRDAAWQQVRAALGAALPDDVRERVASAHESAQQAADSAADAFANDLAAWTRLDAGADELARRVQGVTRAEQERRTALEEAEQRWRAVADASGLPVALTDEGWPARHAMLKELARALQAWQRAGQQAHDDEQAWADFAATVAEVANRHDVLGDTGTQVELLHGRLQQAREARQGLEHLREELDRVATRRQDVEREAAAHDEELAAIQAEFAASSIEELGDIADRTLEHDQCCSELAIAREPLAALFADEAAIDDAVGRLAAMSLPDLQSDLEQLRSVEHERGEEYDAARAARVAAERALTEAEEADGAARAAQEVRSARDRLAELVEEYARTVIALRLLDDRLQAQLQESGSTTLDRAGELLEALTGGRYVALSSRETGDGRRALRVHRGDREPADVDELSEGTADQVFLALRLAGLEQRLDQQRAAGVVPLPVVLDDVLLAFDDDRTDRALRALRDWATDRQVIVTTHHAQVRTAAAALGIAVVDLPEPRPIESLGAPEEVRRSAVADPAPARPSARVTRQEKLARIREWAPGAGYEISARGRIPLEVEEAFDAAHPGLALS